MTDDKEHRLFPFNDSDSYEKLGRIAEDQVRFRSKVNLGEKELCFHDGECTIVVDGKDKHTQALTSLVDWKHICTFLANYWASNTHSSLHLRISRDYFALHTKPLGNELFARTKQVEIHNLMRPNLEGNFDKKWYISRTDLRRITTPDTIRQIIFEDPPQGIGPDEMAAFIDNVKRTAPKLLAQCVFSKLKMDCLKTLIEKGHNDQTPFLEFQHCCHIGCEVEFSALLQSQGNFRAAEFWVTGQHQKFSPQVVLPIHFLGKERRGHIPMDEEKENDSEEESKKIDHEPNPSKKNAYLGSGAYSNVYRVKINCDHHGLSTTSNVFAVKEFRDRPQRANSDFQKELRMLDELRKYRQDHIVTHLATWEQDGKYCMLFPYALCNLRQYMRRTPFDKTNSEKTLWLLDQFRGVAFALRNIHNLSDVDSPVSASTQLNTPAPGLRRSGWHHDLKPENIFFFQGHPL